MLRRSCTQIGETVFCVVPPPPPSPNPIFEESARFTSTQAHRILGCTVGSVSLAPAYIQSGHGTVSTHQFSISCSLRKNADMKFARFFVLLLRATPTEQKKKAHVKTQNKSDRSYKPFWRRALGRARKSGPSPAGAHT